MWLEGEKERGDKSVEREAGGIPEGPGVEPSVRMASPALLGTFEGFWHL